MAAKRRHSYDLCINASEVEHLKLIEELDLLPLTDSCCEICHCDCYSSHRSTDFSEEIPTKTKARSKSSTTIQKTKTKSDKNNNSNSNKSKEEKQKLPDKSKCHGKRKVNTLESISQQSRRTRSKSPLVVTAKTNQRASLKRCKSAGSLQSCGLTPSSSFLPKSHYTKDCELLQDLLTSLETPRLEVKGGKKMNTQTMPRMSKTTLSLPTPTPTPRLTPAPASNAMMKRKSSKVSSFSTSAAFWSIPRMCESMANLCLEPAIRDAYQQVPMHDKKILNRMASKRTEKLLAKENAWLARKFWENERYERELLKYEQMEEYKCAVRDKQFQDYLVTKERLNELAHKDFQELQRLRENLAQKDALTKQRLDTLRVERDIQMCQRRCEELRKSEAVNLHQEEKHLDDVMRKQEICGRLTQRLRRADEIRNQTLDSYLKRLRYDNCVEQLNHEEHYRETQELETMKRAQLKEFIEAKTKYTKRFMEQKQRRMENLNRTAKISASLRELVRSSVTPEGGLANSKYATSTIDLGKLLYDRPISKLCIE